VRCIEGKSVCPSSKICSVVRFTVVVLYISIHNCARSQLAPLWHNRLLIATLGSLNMKLCPEMVPWQLNC
jgi:hypothetical protein